ncbi:hypothetical protein HS041_19875 [Planomonospora sp. ID67723]|uniref:DUF3644 domain-containing protein n=1 Tax=Planomonospora sp. ID67723 TaxID=2738134 RepID=UPI0018C3B583|nr:DUF3644 domain-containing protein [Planomonospora sp. ID67723]MBG0830031.1 hypothetical protein [Planomonospora sp. ID67723]
MKLKQETRVLEGKALSSFRQALTAFNSPEEDGRATRVLLCLQHSFEMLLKATLVQRRGASHVFDSKLGRSIGFDKCLNPASNDSKIRLTTGEAGTLRAIDTMRDDEQHWYNIVPEQVLYLHARAAVTIFDDLLARVFSDRLADHLPVRVLPLSTEPPQDLQLLIDREYSQIQKLLTPGRRVGHDAKARIRTLLALEAHVDPDVRVSDKDVTRVEKAIKTGSQRTQIFPKLSNLGTAIEDTGITVSARISKAEYCLPVRLVTGDEATEAAAIREFDLQKRYPHSAADLAKKLDITGCQRRSNSDPLPTTES